MNRIINLVIPAAGKGSRFSDAGWKKPKPFIDVNGRSMLERVIENVKPINCNVNLIINSEHISKNEDAISKLRKNSNINFIHEVTEGTACTVLMSRSEIDNDNPLLS